MALSPQSDSIAPSARWPIVSGECADLLRSPGWSAVTLGAPATWPRNLRTCLDLMLPSGAQIVLFWGADFIAFYNDAYAPTIGLKHPRAMGRPASEGWAELWDDLGPLLQSVRDTGETISAADRPFQIDRQGFMEQVFFDISYSPVHGESGGVDGVMCIVKETTQGVLAARDLAASREELRAQSERISLALDSGTVIGTWVWDVKADRITGDERFARTFNIDRKLLDKGVPLSQAKQSIHEDDTERVNAAITESMSRGGAYSSEYRVRQHDGSWLWIEANGRVELGEDGTPARFPGVLIDISRRRKIEEAREADLDELRRVQTDLTESLQHLRLAQAAGGIGTFVLDVAKNRVTVSEEFCRLYGLPLALDYPADTLERLIDVGTPSSNVNRVDGSAPLNVEYRIRKADTGERRWLVRRAEFERDANGNVRTMRGVVHDVTAQKIAQDALSELNTTLEQRVEARTRELQETEARLRQSQKMEAIGQLTGGIAHDFNNLLQGITGAIEVLRLRLRMGRTEDADRYLQSAVQSAQRAAALVHRMLAFARRQSLDAQGVDVNALVFSMEDLLRRTIGENITLRVEADPDAWTALCDGNQVESAILNLAINGRDAMARGGTLTIRTSNVLLDAEAAKHMESLAPGDYVSLSVTDTGAGMSPDVLAKAFEPFYTTKPIGQGTGLGLSMIYGFARQSHGHVVLTSEVGKGTVATLYLPRYLSASAESSGAVMPPTPQGEGEVILVVEDDVGVRAVVVETLSVLGYRVLEAQDHVAAMPHLREAPRIDLMVSDVGLPGINGRQLAEMARQLRPGLRVLLMTGYTAAATQRSEFLGIGMELLTKPFSVDDLGRKVREMLPG